jgi:hypothetical protein
MKAIKRWWLRICYRGWCFEHNVAKEHHAMSGPGWWACEACDREYRQRRADRLKRAIDAYRGAA